MGERPVFLREELPDFSLLQRLLCLEPEPWRLLPPPGTGGAATAAPRRPDTPELPPPPRSPPSLPGESLGFLQEAVQLLSPPGSSPPPLAALTEPTGVPAVPPASPDALSLINLQCQLLAGGTGSDSGASTGNDSGTGSDSGASTGSDSGTGSSTGSDSGASAGAASGTGSNSGTRSDSGTGSDRGAGTGAVSCTGSDSGVGTRSDRGTGSDSSTGSSTGTDSNTGTDSGTGSSTGSARRRKQALPQRGADPRDSSFRGVTLRMRLAFPAGDTEDCRLLVTACGHRIPSRSRGSCSSDDDTAVSKGPKRCTSCKTRRTPMWRTAEGGTVLCNACGIRYRKYRVRCRWCWNIPGKSGTPQCPRCPQCPSRPAGQGGDSEDPTAAG